MRPLLLGILLATAFLAGCAEEPASAPTPTASMTPPTSVTTPTAADPPARACTPANANPVWRMDTTMGVICIELLEDKTPITVENIIKLTEAGCYDGTRFHRVITNFMDQGGDPLSKDEAQRARWGTGGPSDCGQDPDTIVDEFYCSDGSVSNTHPATCPSGLGLMHDEPGVLSMANTGQAHTGGSQFFLTAVATPWLDGKHAIFGHTADDESLAVALAINEAGSQGGTPRTLVTLTDASIVRG